MTRRVIITIVVVGSIAAAVGFFWNRFAAQHEISPSATNRPSAAVPDEPAKRQILYYRNPMGLPDTSPVPKKDAMGMDYVPVYAGEELETGQVRISTDRLQKLGVRSAMATRRPFTLTLRIVGTFQINERLESTVNAKFEGWITELFVNTTGARVSKGQPLLEVYSPDLVSSQQDYRVAVEAEDALKGGDADARASAARLVQSSIERLRNWDIADADLSALRQGAPPRRTLILRAQRSGIVIQKLARQGMRFMPGEPLYQIADLSSVWLIGSVFEQDLPYVRVGQQATATLAAYTGQTFTGTVTFISPVLQTDSRTAQVRIEFPNRDALLKPAMYANVELVTRAPGSRLAVPESAVLDTGTRQIVIVDRGNGTFEPREVDVGVRGDGYAEILEGLVEHESVVVDGNFLIDSESNLKSAIGALAGHAHGKPPSPSPAATPPAHQHAPPGS